MAFEPFGYDFGHSTKDTKLYLFFQTIYAVKKLKKSQTQTQQCRQEMS